MSKFFRVSFLGFAALIVSMLLSVSMPHDASANGCSLSSDELIIANLMSTQPEQTRPYLTCDPTLTYVARARALDMGTRNYFGHTNPDGIGPNYLITQAGYQLPAWWGTHPSSNYVESIAAGTYMTPQDSWNAWMGSPGHRTHLLAEIPFYSDQVAYGIGVVDVPGSVYSKYYVVLTAPLPNQ